MRDTPYSILAVFAHPDDEIGIGSTLYHYAEGGVLISLVCASRGEAATIYCDDCATRENLAEVRTRELECACRNLGITELRWLDWPDGGVAELPRGQATHQVVHIIRELQPDIIITHPENGLYPHPDHLAVWEITRDAFRAAGDPARFPEAGAPWSPARLYTRGIPQSFFDAAPAFAQYRVQLKGEQLPFYATPDADIDVIMEVSCCVEHRQEAWECHRSQHNPEGAFSQMPEEVRRAMWESEHFVVAAERVPLPPEGRHDLLAGLEAWSDAPDATQDPTAPLRTGLAVRRAYLELNQEYLRSTKDERFQKLLEPLPDQEQDFIYSLAQGLRRADGTPGTIAPDPRLLAQGRACHGMRARARFLLATARHAVRRYQELLEGATSPELREVWAELLPLAEARLATVAEYGAAV